MKCLQTSPSTVNIAYVVCWYCIDLCCCIHSAFVADVPYEMTVYTSDVMGAGTSANVYVVLYGSDGATEEVILADTAKKKKNSFKRGSVDQFVKEVC